MAEEPGKDSGGKEGGATGETGAKRVATVLGVITSAIAIIAWIGPKSWPELKTWLNENVAEKTTTRPTSKPYPYTPVATPNSKPPPELDPACEETSQITEAITASARGASANADAAALMYRGHARSYERAAATAKDARIRSAIRAAAVDMYALADAVEARDFGAAKAVLSEFSTDARAISTACIEVLEGK